LTTAKNPPGIVYLIGAGPGDPKLITVRGLECIRRADVIVYDYLANPRLLSESKPGSSKVYVGKRGSDHTAEQDEINKLLVSEAQAGRVVARLKGGDAFVFGRGGEEALFLSEHGIPFEVVPGVSSAYAVPAYAGIPVTHRGLASDVSFITGHERPANDSPGTNWEMLAKSGGTLVFLMGVKNLSLIVEQLTRHGKPADTPVAVIRWGTLADQETLIGSLADIATRVSERDFRPPAVIVVGRVVTLSDRLSWFGQKPLSGRRVLVTRAAGQAGSLTDVLESAGAEVVEFPTIEIQPVEDWSIIDQAIEKLRTDRSGFDWAIFTSANAVDFFIQRLRRLGGDVRLLADLKIAAVGTATAARLEDQNLSADLVPDDFKAEGLIEEFGRMPLGGRKILIPRAREARGILPERLREMGAEVTVAPLYRNVRPSGLPVDRVKRDLKEGRIDVITFTSGSTVRNFADILAGNGNVADIIGPARIAVIGPVTAGAARRLGLSVDIMPSSSTIPALVEAIIDKKDIRE
jgi:uroporphyrinogen III methyltransferase / synthase